MKKSSIDIQENDLHAYVDNQLSEEKRQAVEELIRKDPEIAALIQVWQQQNDAMTEYFNDESYVVTDIPDSLKLDKLKIQQESAALDNTGLKNTELKNKSEVIPLKHTQLENTKPQGRPWYYSMAASLLLMMGSGFIGWTTNDIFQAKQQTPPIFANMAISAYEVFSVEVLHPVEVRADKKEHLVKWLSKRVGHPIKMPELENYGFKLLGGRLLSMQEGRPAAQFMFENKQGKRITWLVSKSPVYKDHSFLFKNEKTINSYYWMDSNVAYSVSGEMDRDNLHKLSQGIYQQINDQENS